MAADLPVPVFSSLAEIYPSQSAVLREGWVFTDKGAELISRDRWNSLVESFTKTYGQAPSHVVRAPGRVNILGEHIDYSLFVRVPLISLERRANPSLFSPRLLSRTSSLLFAPARALRPPSA